MSVTSVNLAVTPFISSCDSTRLNMAAKQFSQSLTHINCEKPYIINNEWSTLTNSSSLGIKIAKKDGKVIYNKNDLIIINYNDGETEVVNINPTQQTTSIYASSLRNSLKQGSEFNKNDIIYEYDSFYEGIPSSGYNVSTMYCPFFGYNHEDSLIISENFANRAKHKYCETIYIPITEYTLFSKLYDNAIKYFPDVGEHINGHIVCSSLLPKNIKSCTEFNNSSIKSQVLSLFQSMNLSDLINIKISNGKNNFSSENINTSIENGIVSGFKIHKIKKDIKLIDSELQEIIEKLYKRYNIYILNLYNDLNKIVNDSFAKSILREYYIYADRKKIRKNIDLSDVVYIIEMEISKEVSAHLGDKMSS